MASEAPVPPDGQLHATTIAAAPLDAADGAPKPKRSWRRKYRKMRAKFEDTMTTSNTLIKDEFKAMALARRLQEQNDQILEVLLDMNDAARLPASLRFDLRDLSEIDAAIPALEVELDPKAIQQKLLELRTDLQSGVITTEEYARKADQLHNPKPILTTRTLAALLAKVPHTSGLPDLVPDGIELGEHAPGYMSPSHEEEYLHATDVALADPSLYDPDAHDGRPLRITPAHPIPNEKDLTIRNPDSVYNWLRKHQPQVFLQDKDPQHPENMSEKSSARPGNTSRGGKRQSAVQATTPGPKTEHELPDDEVGFIPETGTGGKGKRGVKEDDNTYRPKGGSSRPGKRKREEGDPVVKGGRKKNRVSGAVAAS